MMIETLYSAFSSPVGYKVRIITLLYLGYTFRRRDFPQERYVQVQVLQHYNYVFTLDKYI